MTLQEAFQQAFGLQQAGRLADAERIYLQIVAQRPNHADALHMLGVISCQTARIPAGIVLLRQVIALRPTYAEAYRDLGNALLAQRNFAEVIAIYQKAISFKPDLFAVHANLGVAFVATGQIAEAISACRTAIALQANSPDVYSNLADALTVSGQLDEAITACQKAIALKPDSYAAWYNLGIALRDKRQIAESVAAFRRANAINPNAPLALSNLAGVLRYCGQVDEAIKLYRQVVSSHPNMHEAHSNLANALAGDGQIDEAIAAYRRSIALKPNSAPKFSNLGNALMDAGRLEESLAAHRKATALDPKLAEARVNLARILLLLGNFPEGWPEYEYRLLMDKSPSILPRVDLPRWDGSELRNGTILLHCEQGYGDTLQFVRYATLVTSRCAKVIVMCQPRLAQLIQTVPGVAQVVTPNDSLPSFDVHCPLHSLPLIFGTTLQTIPNAVPYIKADANEIEKWRQHLPGFPSGLKVGLAWAGNPANPRNRLRSMQLSTLAPLAQIPNVTFFSLQKDEGSSQVKNPPAPMTIINWTDEQTTFSDTAAQIANLDLVISVDSAVAHLAGAMGKPVWNLLSFAADWRWLTDRDDCPWYSTMRLFRQTSPGDWDGVMRQVAQELRGFKCPK